jgi:hypothetical protein
MNEEKYTMKLELLQAAYDRLEKENLHLRKLLSISSDILLTLPDDQKSDDINNHVLSSTEKIKLYRSLFRGREDVYAVRWESKNGRAGYSPACANEWDRRVCRKPQIKCSECPHSQWLPITDQVIHDHLTGKIFIGVYPLQVDESCYFLAIDFDKETWREDALAFIKTCRQFSIDVLLERSQSGNGAHVWIFFSESISARLARLLGTALLTQTMRACSTLRMESYDRLFPSQDTLPKGGFGNLIALPLQGTRRKKGNSLFLTDEGQPHVDPWELLSTLRPLSQQTVLSLLRTLEQQGDWLDVQTSQT